MGGPDRGQPGDAGHTRQAGERGPVVPGHPLDALPGGELLVGLAPLATFELVDDLGPEPAAAAFAMATPYSSALDLGKRPEPDGHLGTGPL